MKKVAFIIAMCFCAAMGVKASATEVTKVEIHKVQDKIEIAASDLPQVVKDAIEEDSETKDLSISNAYQVTDQNGEVTYEVKFGTGEQSITNTYDAEGKKLVEE